MATHVVAKRGEVRGEIVRDFAPNAEIGAERIGEDDQGFSRPAVPVLVMKRDAADFSELHPGSSFSQIDMLFQFRKIISFASSITIGLSHGMIDPRIKL